MGFPVCGSGNGSVDAYIRHTGQIGDFGNDFLATQGTTVGRAGVLKMTGAEDVIRVGSNAITYINGTLSV